jgi:hypothetical protein
MSATLEQHAPGAAARVTAGPPMIRAGVGAFGVTYLGLGFWMAVSPHTFYTALGPFDVYNSHYIRDVATFHLALGVGFLAALRIPSWRVPMLAIAAVQFALHSINHLVDIDTAHPAWVGYFDFFSLAAATAQLAWLLAVMGRNNRDRQLPKGASQI